MTLPIFLIGARGCGKTTVGHALSQLHVCQFVDTDHWLQEQAQMTVAQLVSKEGWHGFRARETEALEAVTAPARVSVLVDRLEAYPKESQRPTLTGKPIREEVGEILAGREALYREAAHHVVNAAQDLDLVIAEIQTALRLARAS